MTGFNKVTYFFAYKHDSLTKNIQNLPENAEMNFVLGCQLDSRLTLTNSEKQKPGMMDQLISRNIAPRQA